ncbi:MAG TPA: hypothetical protein VM683_00815 [Anaeromyxobacteraceae bacterium]|nr:hypothetical protein [Anaeromyxobacteraceae bacterium]
MSHPVATFLRQLARIIFARETLPATEPQRADRGGCGGFVRLLFTLEPLPRDPVSAHSRRSLLAGVFARERLPMDPELPRRPSRWLSWLFVPERLDRDPKRPQVD